MDLTAIFLSSFPNALTLGFASLCEKTFRISLYLLFFIYTTFLGFTIASGHHWFTIIQTENTFCKILQSINLEKKWNENMVLFDFQVTVPSY